MASRLVTATDAAGRADYEEALTTLSPEDRSLVVAAIEFCVPLAEVHRQHAASILSRMVTRGTGIRSGDVVDATNQILHGQTPAVAGRIAVIRGRLDTLSRLRMAAAGAQTDETVVMDRETLDAISRGEELWHPREWGPFHDLRPVGGGGFGSVYRAWDTQLLRDVALKLLRTGSDSTEVDQAAALHEARMMARVRHPNIVPVYGVETHDGRVGFWSEFVEGATLSAIVRRSGPLPPREAAAVVAEVCKAMVAVHAAGMLHRDIKAENVIREAKTGRILLMDFGLSHESGIGREAGGTPAYMAPELFLGKAPSPASDIYALGALLYFLLSGLFPAGGSLGEIRAAAISGTYKPLREVKPGLPGALLEIVERATAGRSEGRFVGPEGMLQALTAFHATAESVAKPRSRMPWVAGAVVVVGLAAYFWTMRGGPSAGANQSYQEAHALLLRRDQSGNVAKAIGLYEQTIQRDPKFALAWAELADAQWEEFRRTTEAKYRDAALANAEKALALDKDLAPVYVVLGKIHTGTGQRNLGVQNFGRGRQLDPRNADLYRELGQLYDTDGRTAEAEESLQKAVDLSPNDWRNTNSLGLHYLSAGKVDQAAEQLKRALEITPDNPRVWSNLGVVRARQGQLPEAREAYEKALQFAPDNYATLVALGSLYERQGDFEQAATAYEKAVTINPSNYLTWANLASAWHWGSGGMGRAMPAYQKAVELAEAVRKVTPTDAELLARLGSYYASLNDGKKSQPLLRQAIALDPDNPNVLGRVAEGYEILGQRELALPLVIRALKRGYPADMIRRSPDFSKLREDPRFRFPNPNQQ